MAATRVTEQFPPNLDVTKAPLAFGQRALPKLNEELQDGQSLEIKLQALRSLNDKLRSPTNIQQAIDAGIVKSTQHLLKDQDVLVRQLTVRLVGHFTQHSIGRTALLQQGILPTLCELYHDTDVLVRQRAHSAVHMLTTTAQGTAALLDLAQVAVLVYKLEVEREHDIILVPLLDTLTAIMKFDTSAVLTSRGIDQFLALFTNANPQVVASAARALAELCVSAEGKQQAVETQAVDKLVPLLQHTSSLVITAACNALASICITTPGKEAFAQSDAGLAALVRLLSMPNEDVQLAAIKAIHVTCEAPTCRAYYRVNALQQGPATLAQLQNLIKRDKEAYAEEFFQQYRRYEAMSQVFRLKPDSAHEDFGELVSFLSAVAHCFPDTLKNLPQELAELLEKHAEVLDPELRMTLCRALILLRNKDMIKSSALLQLFFTLFRCPDKQLRSTLYNHIVNDIRRLNAKHQNHAVNKALQNYMFTMINDPCLVAARKCLDAMIELYNRNIWKDDKCVNVIAQACLHEQSKIATTAVNFFLQDKIVQQIDGDDEDAMSTYKAAMAANEHNRKTAKRKKQASKALKQAQRQERKRNNVPVFHFQALHQIHNPQTTHGISLRIFRSGFAERLLAKLRQSKSDKFDVRLMYMNLISRLVGVHELVLLNFYPFLQRYLQPYQQDVTKVLTYLAQASHEYVPDDALESILKTIADNFVTERSSPESIAVGSVIALLLFGSAINIHSLRDFFSPVQISLRMPLLGHLNRLNSIAAICARCPLAMTQPLLEDLIQYKSSKHKIVTAAARSLIQLFREKNPELLPRKERGRPDGQEHEVLGYGESKPLDMVPGTELLSLYEEAKASGEIIEEEGDDGWETASDDSDDEADWVTVEHSDDEDSGKASKRAKSKDDAAVYNEQRDDLVQDTVDKATRLQRAKELSMNKILTQEDFERIKKLQAQQMLRPAFGAKTTAKEERDVLREEDILPDVRKRRQSKEERLAQIEAGREDRGKFGYRKSKTNEYASTTNKDKAKRKNPMMLKHARKAVEKRGRDLRTKQIDARKSKQKDQRNRK
ncbi:uncharacterized protein MONBRDRAFT_38740 [Monosiga brevicollis MX1]|uniref:Protein SDA1 n=1 Tax=Monosiga brevicollis TaxID=81824 RepID=A9V9U5_MONBE|nr:uncharacterized protein MONBRDRAFT_38740 [Monosiga brevicollis MX1]EDQ85727.1 predicted protein [Monosiga brevicollis MX1]|eukprot:XP_001749442.1 hypothetical protein [Monosiga brevicollis MX1]